MDHHLVDALGGLDSAVKKAKELARVTEDVDLVLRPRPVPWYDALFSGVGGKVQNDDFFQLISGNLVSGRPLTLLPFTLFWE